MRIADHVIKKLRDSCVKPDLHSVLLSAAEARVLLAEVDRLRAEMKKAKAAKGGRS